MRYAKTNLRSVEDSAVTFGLSETQEARFPRADLGAEQTGINFLTRERARGDGRADPQEFQATGLAKTYPASAR